MTEKAYRVDQAAQLLGITPRRVRQLCECGLLEAERSPGGHWRIIPESITQLKENGIPPVPTDIPPDEHEPPEAETPEPAPPVDDAQPDDLTAPPPSERVATAREDVLITASRLEKRRIEKDLEETEDFFRARQEQQATREAAGRKEALEAQAKARKLQWVQEWAQAALVALDRIAGVPEEYRLPVYQQAERVLGEVAQIPPDATTQYLIAAAIATALKPWYRQQETARIIEKARETLPAHAKNTLTATAWELRARRTAAAAIAELPDDAPEAQRESVSMAVKKGSILAGEKGPVRRLRSGLPWGSESLTTAPATFRSGCRPSLWSWAHDRTCP